MDFVYCVDFNFMHVSVEIIGMSGQALDCIIA